MNIKVDELSKVSYLKVPKVDGRSIPLFACYQENGEWEQWIPQNDNLLRLKMLRLIEGRYYAKKPHSENDLYLKSVDFFHKRIYWHNVRYKIDAFCQDISNLFASLKKMEILFSIKKNYPGIHTMVSTEIEYQFITCRSIYDLLQEIIQSVWDNISLFDKNIKKKKLPSSFRKMVFNNDNELTVDEIISKYSIPNKLATYYASQASFFLWLREFRDLVTHKGKSFDIVFITENGFAIQNNVKPFSMINIWDKNNTIQNKLSSVKSFSSYLILNTIESAEKFVNIVIQLFGFPYDISPDYKMFIKDSNFIKLTELKNNISDTAWYN